MGADIARLNGDFATCAMRANQCNLDGTDATGHVRRMNDALAAGDRKREAFRRVLARMSRVAQEGSRASPAA